MVAGDLTTREINTASGDQGQRPAVPVLANALYDDGLFCQAGSKVFAAGDGIASDTDPPCRLARTQLRRVDPQEANTFVTAADRVAVSSDRRACKGSS